MVEVSEGIPISKGVENLCRVAGYSLSKSFNFSEAHSLCVLVRAWLLAISESSSWGDEGARSSIIWPLWA